MKSKLLLIGAIVILTGCSQQPETTDPDTGMIEATSTERVLTASDVHIEDQYQFAVSSDVISGVDTYSGPVQIKTDDKTNLTVYGSDRPIANFEYDTPVEDSTLIGQIVSDGKDERIYTFSAGEQYNYYQIVASEECDIVVAVV